MEEECKIPMNTGLRGVTVASTRICEVDGKNGRLIYRGYLIQDLAGACYEEIVHLLLYERLPTTSELEQFRKTLAGAAEYPGQRRRRVQDIPPYDQAHGCAAGRRCHAGPP